MAQGDNAGRAGGDAPRVDPPGHAELRLLLAGEPPVKKRPRFRRLPDGRTVTYTPQATVLAERDLAWDFTRARAGRAPLACPLAVEIVIALRGRKRVDVDNVIKAILDAGNGVVWLDDELVVEVTCRKLFDQGQDSTGITVRRGEETRKRCPCGEVAPPGRVYCSADHMRRYRRAGGGPAATPDPTPERKTSA